MGDPLKKTDGAQEQFRMPFGLGFNKTKTVGAAEKYVAQGKIPAAIDEYRKILQKDPNDLMVLSTIGDLYVRCGKSDFSAISPKNASRWGWCPAPSPSIRGSRKLRPIQWMPC
jgi:hypothetical protein